MSEKKDIFWRAYLIYFGFVILMIVVFSKTLIIQFEGNKKIFMSSSDGKSIMPTRIVKKEPRRGEILDINNTPLVTSVSFYDIYMDPTVVSQDIFDRDLAGLCQGLNKIYPEKTAQQYEDLIRNARATKSKYLLIHRKATNEQRKKLRELPVFKLGKLKGGLIDNIETIVRKRPHGELLKRTLGYVQPENKLYVGLEGAYNDYLKGVPGEEIEVKISNSWKKEGKVTKDAIEGADIVTTFDIDIQDVAHSELLNQLQKQGAKNGSVIVMDVKTGEIRAMVNLTRASDGEYYEQFNNAIANREVPGSTFKLASLMSALEDGKIRITDSVDAVGRYTYYGKTLEDSRSWGYGRITIQHAFEKSSNVISKVIYDAYKNKPQDFIDRLKSFGLHEALGLEIKGELPPSLPEPGDDRWSKISLPWLAIGYEIEQTPLQTLTFYNAVANNGKLVKPQFIKEIRQGNEVIKKFNPTVLNPKICSDRTVKSLKQCLEGVVEHGTGTALKSSYFKIAGKTGTAVIKNAPNAADRVYQASFVGYFPADNPMYSCIVVVSAPTQDIYGAVVSGTVFSAIANKVYASSFKYHKAINSSEPLEQNIPNCATGLNKDISSLLKTFRVKHTSSTEKDWTVPMETEGQLELKERYVGVKTVPNVIGMTAKDAVFLIERTGMVAKIQGSGRVKSQSINPGTSVFSGGVVKIILE